MDSLSSEVYRLLTRGGDEAMERDGALSVAAVRPKRSERAVGEAVVLGVEINKVQNELLSKQ